MFEIMNFLDERLRHNNSAVVLAAVRVFLRVTIDSGAMHYQVHNPFHLSTKMLEQGWCESHQYISRRRVCDPIGCEQVLERVRAPLITLMTGGSPETAYILLKHIIVLAQVTMSPVIAAISFISTLVNYCSSCLLRLVLPDQALGLGLRVWGLGLPSIPLTQSIMQTAACPWSF